MIYYEQNRADPDGGIYHQRNTNLNFYQHLHDSFELICVLDGELHVTVDGGLYRIKEGEAILILPNQIHQGHTPQHSSSYLCIFENALVGEFYGKVKVFGAQQPVFSIADTDLVARLSEANGSRYHLKSLLYEVIDRFDRNADGYLSRGNRAGETVGRILTIISRRFAEPITMQAIARELGYDHRYLSNLLQKGLNTTFRRLLNEYRVTHAKRLLLKGDLPVSNVASECGYDSICSFNRNFRQLTGVTPTAYREKHARKRATTD